MTDFDLRQTVRDVARERDSWDLDALAARVFESTPPKQIRAAYLVALREYARVELSRFTQDSQPGHGRNDAQSGTAGLGPNVDRSRVALARAGFRMQIHVGPGAWKAIQLCTAAELLYAAAECDRMAEFNAARAQQYRDLVKVMAEHEAERVADLPVEIVEGVFGDDDH